MYTINSLLFAVLTAFAVTTTSSQATTVGFTAAPGSRTVFEENLSTQIAVGSLVWMGTFANDTQVSMIAGTVAANVTAITTGSAGWSQFTGTSSLGIFSAFGNSKVGGQVTENSAAANPFNGDNVYLWVFNSSAVNTATQMGIFRATTADTAWVFPNNAGGVGDGTTLSTASTFASVITSIGGVGSADSSRLILESPGIAPVPEPSTFVVGAMLALAAMGVRRRRA